MPEEQKQHDWPAIAATWPDYHQIIDGEVKIAAPDDLDKTLFLYCIWKLNSQEEENDLQFVWQTMSHYWRQRLPADAYQCVKEECVRRYNEIQAGKLSASVPVEPKQLAMEDRPF